MSYIGEYPNLTNGNCPYLDTLKRKLQYAREYHPNKVAYYEALIKDWLDHSRINVQIGDENTDVNQDLWQFPENNDY